MANYKVVVNRTQEFDDETLFHSDTFLGNEFSDEMYHWKYIKREKVNGKWRYYYNTSELNKYDSGKTETTSTKNADGSTTNTETTYRKHDGLFDKKSTMSIKFGGKDEKIMTTKTQGKLSRSYAKAEKKIFDTFYSGSRKTQKASSFREIAKKGKTKLRKFLGIH